MNESSGKATVFCVAVSRIYDHFGCQPAAGVDANRESANCGSGIAPSSRFDASISPITGPILKP
jgi:hypothetical protein